MKSYVVAMCLLIAAAGAAPAAAPAFAYPYAAPIITYKGLPPLPTFPVVQAFPGLPSLPTLPRLPALPAAPALIAKTEPAIPTAPAAALVNPRRFLPPLQHEEIHDEFGQFALRYVTAEGTVVSERGYLVPTPDGKAHVMVTEGETSYVGPDGKTYVTKYTAGLDGYKAQGNHLPVAPEPLPVQ